MASTIILSDNGVSSGSAGLKQTAGNDGVLILQTTTSGGTATNAVYVDTSQNVGVGVTPSAWNAANKVIEFLNSTGTSNISSGSSYFNFGNNNYYNGSSYIYKGNGYAANYQQTPTGTHVWQTAASGTAGGTISFTQSLALGKGTSLALEGATSQTGTGITFPAAQNASSDVNTLDDYEEGTWSPNDQSGAGLTFTNVTGIYVKIGKFIIAQCSFKYPTTLSGSNAIIGGLPFVCTANGGGFSMYVNGSFGIVGRNQTSSTNIIFTNVTSQASPITNANLSGLDVQFTFIYQS